MRHISECTNLSERSAGVVKTVGGVWVGLVSALESQVGAGN
jgi:hypothetical protein